MSKNDVSLEIQVLRDVCSIRKGEDIIYGDILTIKPAIAHYMGEINGYLRLQNRGLLQTFHRALLHSDTPVEYKPDKSSPCLGKLCVEGDIYQVEADRGKKGIIVEKVD